MNDNPLERLLVDASLDELTPECRWLLDEYLSEHPEKRRESTAVDSTLELARRALRQPEARSLPLPPMPDFSRARRQGRFAWALWPAVASACLIAGWLLGSLHGQVPLRQGPARTLAEQRVVSPSHSPRVLLVSNGEELAEQEPGDFWSTQRWIERLHRSRPKESTPGGIEWQAPFVPRIETVGRDAET